MPRVSKNIFSKLKWYYNYYENMYGFYCLLNKIYFVICYVFLPNFNIKFQKQKKFIEELCLNFRIRKSSRDRSQILHLMTSSQLQRQEDKKASVLIWISIIFIICQSVKLAPDLYEALFCTHKGVRLECLFLSFLWFQSK